MFYTTPAAYKWIHTTLFSVQYLNAVVFVCVRLTDRDRRRENSHSFARYVDYTSAT